MVTTDVAALEQRLEREQEYPRQDYRELADSLSAQIISFTDVSRSRGAFLKLVRCLLGKGCALALYAFWQKGEFYFTTAENVGFPLAFLLKFRPRARHVMIGHKISAVKKRLAAKIFNLFSRIDHMICYSVKQVDYARDYLHVPERKLNRINFQVDPDFFEPSPVSENHGSDIVSVGRELRDYATLFDAVAGTDLTATVVASSPWSKRRDRTKRRSVPPNVRLISGLAYRELKDLYQNCRIVVVPLLPVDSPAGVTSILEAQAAGKPVVVSATPGIADSILPGINAITVPCRDAQALRSALQRLMRDKNDRESLGAAGRRAAVKENSIDLFIKRIKAVCDYENT